jgi:ATP-dependent Clp protease protease subunit
MRRRSNRLASEFKGACYFNEELKTIFLVGDIEHEMASKFRRAFLRLSSQGTAPITVEINTGGGDDSAGALIVDTILNSPLKVITRAAGRVYSMGVAILAAGDIRESLPRSRFMLHWGSVQDIDDVRAEDLQYALNEYYNWDYVYWGVIANATGKSQKYWKDLCRNKEHYFGPTDAQMTGLIHNIIRGDSVSDASDSGDQFEKEYVKKRLQEE